MITIRDIGSAHEIISGQLHRTSLIRSTILGKMINATLLFKLEMFQKTGSFKIRGVMNKLHHLDSQERQRGVIGFSAGNHAQALAYSATALGINSTLVMPSSAVDSKVKATESYGGKVVLTDEDLVVTTLSIQKSRGLTLVHPFDDPLVIAGAGTVGKEIVEDAPRADIVIAGVGGGGLISGIAVSVKAANPLARVIGVEPEGAAAMTASLLENHPVNIETLDTVADGLAATHAGEHTFAHVQAYVDDVVIVTDDEIIEAMRMIMTYCKVVVEPAAASTFAALLFGKVKVEQGATVVCVLSGGNVDVDKLKLIM